ncbi:cellulose binding domain-containing protein [Actinoplanes siamensis]|uniref:Hydrolase n=1 Tax=Actinoplanes siamensis TaxID=1223317 RepID=A0A919NBR2_9ACTN|nr:cellulose binding domain-containing protein [Actinoplanes siamensis]GIF07859.1 hydrolase [Actinoplanes siamensis]
MNTLKGFGIVVLLAALAVAVRTVARIDLVVLAVTVATIAASTFTFLASRRRFRNDIRIAGAGAQVRQQSLLAPLLSLTMIAGGVACLAVARPDLLEIGKTATGDAPLTVRYRAGASSAPNVGKLWLDVVNTSAETVELRDVKVRYYFTADGASVYGVNCFQTALRCSSISKSISTLSNPSAAADHQMVIGFTSGAGRLDPGKSTQGIGLQLYRPDHKKLDQHNDRSFDSKATRYQPSKTVTAYLKGTLAWGQEPSPQGSAANQTGPDVAGPPPGVMFDNFHYTGHDDPALAANGWMTRTESGGPGIHGSYVDDANTFPADKTAQGGQALQLRASTDGTSGRTRQAEFSTTGPVFFTGTLAARVFFTDKPAKGSDGDHVNHAFNTISPSGRSPKYSELDYEYQPNGGWGAPGPKMDIVSWRSTKQGDRDTRAVRGPLAGWHILMITATADEVTYRIDGRKVFTSSGRSVPQERMKIQFSSWFIDLPFTGPRTWDMRVNWVYARDGRTMSVADVKKAVDRLYAGGINHANSIPRG